MNGLNHQQTSQQSALGSPQQLGEGSPLASTTVLAARTEVVLLRLVSKKVYKKLEKENKVRYTKGVPYLSEMVYKRVRGGTLG